MATLSGNSLNAVQVARLFGSPAGQQRFTQQPTEAELAAMSGGVPAAPPPTAQPTTGPSAPPTTTPPTAPQAPPVNEQVPSFSREPTAPTLKTPPGFGVLPPGGSQFDLAGGGQFSPMGADTQIDPTLLAALQGRAQGEGMVGLEAILSGVGRPELDLMNQEFERQQEGLLQDLVDRGVISSEEAANRMSRLAQGFAGQKASVLGQLGLQHETLQQQNMNQAFQQMTGLELGRVQANTAITTANIGASAQVQSSAIAASATTQSASIHAAAQLQSAQLNAQAALQRAGMDYDIAQKALDRQVEMTGWDPVRAEQDPFYRQDWLDYQAMVQQSKDALIEAQVIALIGDTAFGGAA